MIQCMVFFSLKTSVQVTDHGQKKESLLKECFGFFDTMLWLFNSPCSAESSKHIANRLWILDWSNLFNLYIQKEKTVKVPMHPHVIVLYVTEDKASVLLPCPVLALGLWCCTWSMCTFCDWGTSPDFKKTGKAFI